jgi:3',5'-cyclic AMP phosphodiesterase CpdA
LFRKQKRDSNGACKIVWITWSIAVAFLKFMKTIVQISDLHFGRINYDVIEYLREAVNEIKPDLLVVSGDLTQRARSHQFQEAREFLDSLPKPQIVVPGNHDVPLHDVLSRFISPLAKYKKFITDDLRPFYIDDEIAVMGINTARSFTVKGGRINEDQAAAVREKFCGLEDKILKAVVTHHPFDVGRARMAMRSIADCGVDLFIAGHIHVGYMSDTAKRYDVGAGRPALIVQAGTATSTRARGQTNSFNLIEFGHPHLTVKRLDWVPEKRSFQPVEVKAYVHSETGWQRS